MLRRRQFHSMLGLVRGVCPAQNTLIYTQKASHDLCIIVSICIQYSTYRYKHSYVEIWANVT